MTEIVLCVWVRVSAGREKMEGATDMVNRGRDHETDKEVRSRTRRLIPSDFVSL